MATYITDHITIYNTDGTTLYVDEPLQLAKHFDEEFGPGEIFIECTPTGLYTYESRESTTPIQSFEYNIENLLGFEAISNMGQEDKIYVSTTGIRNYFQNDMLEGWHLRPILKSSITNLTGTTWYLNEWVDSGCIANDPASYVGFHSKFNINFTSSDAQYTALEYDLSDGDADFDSCLGIMYVGENGVTTVWPGYGVWENEDYRTFTITGGEDVANQDLIDWLTLNATRVISDLTNTSWYFNETLDHFGIGEPDGFHIGALVAEFSVNFYAGNHHPYTSLGHYGYECNLYYEPNYDPTFNFVPYEGDRWTDEDCRTIWITGGDDVTNPDLISWITQNATQVENPTIITDVTNTSWYFNDVLDHWGVGNIEVVGGGDEHWSEFNINFTSNNAQYTSLYYELETGTSSDNVHYYTSEGEDTEAYWVDKWEDEAYKTITITGGEAATDPTFIVWLTKNATQVTLEDSDDNGNTETKSGHYLAFTSPKEFTLSSKIYSFVFGPGPGEDKGKYSYEKSWDGTVEYSTDALDWSIWEGDAPLQSVDGKLYLRGIGNTQMSCDEFPRDIDGQMAFCTYQWYIEGEEVSCSGNLENLLDYTVVANGGHPELVEFGFTWLFTGCQALVAAPDFLGEYAPDYAFREMFARCINLRTPPRLAATTLGYSCYTYMFAESGIDKLPELPGIVLGQYCYEHMFEGCSNIKISTEKTDEYKYEYRIPFSGTAIRPEGWEEDEYWWPCSGMFSETGGTFTDDPELHTTYYTNNEIVRAFPPVDEEKPTCTFDLTTLALPVGTYTIYVKLSAPGYRDSEASNEVVYSTEVALDPEFNHYGVIPEGWCLEYTDAEGEFYSLGEGDPFPVDKSIYANHASYYSSDEQYICEENEWRYEEILAADDGGSVVSVLASIDGLPVTSANLSSGNIGMYAIAAIIPVSVTTIVSVAPFWGNGRLTSITYLGTMEQWNQITLEPNWNKGCSEITVTCTDGTITIPAYNS